MADSRHIRRLKQGVREWNRWRRREGNWARVDLTGANLSNMDLSHMDLSRVDLARARLKETDFSHTYLWRTDFSGADLSRAIFFHADLSDAFLRGTNVSHANLSHVSVSNVDLTDANLSRAVLLHGFLSNSILSGTNLAGCIVGGTYFINIDLGETQGLDTVVHTGASVIDIGTILRSRNRVSKIFLRGTGMPERFLEHILLLRRFDFEYHSCFISYSSKDQGFAKRLHSDLQSEGVRCWFAPEDMKIGEKIRPGVDQAIRLHDKLLLVLSKHSVSSNWVETEAESAFARERDEKKTVLFPVRIDDAVVKSKVAWASQLHDTRHIGDFTKWKDHNEYQTAFQRLLRDLNAGGNLEPPENSNG